MPDIATTATGARAPLACITWGRFSPEVEQRYGAPGPQQPRLHPTDWTSGAQLWLVDIVGPSDAIAGALKALATGPFKDQKVRVRKSGVAAIWPPGQRWSLGMVPRINRQRAGLVAPQKQLHFLQRGIQSL